MSEMIERISRAMAEADSTASTYDDLARAAIEAMRGMAPSDAVIDRFESDNCHMSTYHCIASAWDAMIDEAVTPAVFSASDAAETAPSPS